MKKLLFLFFVFELFACNEVSNNQPNNSFKAPATASNNDDNTQRSRGLNRHPSQIRYSHHARCRMDCRHINETEIKYILEKGTINYRKSELNEDACHKRYAVEGYAQNDHLRVIFAPCNNVVTVVTCIDLDKEWSCDCPGDEQHQHYR
jgi:hypothetical protein